MKAIFLADAHLHNPEDAAYRELLAFFRRLPDDLDHLFLLGDFFDFWHGYRTVVFSAYVPVLAGLAELAGRGVKISFFAGNHEISCGPALAELGSCHPDHAIVELDGQRLYLSHGDQLDPDDHGYRLWRALLRSRPLLGLVNLLPTAWTWKIAGRLSRSSRGNGSRKLIPPGVYRNCAEILAGGDFSALICGHFHQPRRETFLTSSGPRPALFVDAWAGRRAYLEWDAGEFHFRNFRLT